MKWKKKHMCIYIYMRVCVYIQSWLELSPLLNMIKEGSENKPALLILLIFYLKQSQNLTFHWVKTIENGGKSHYE